VINVPSAGRIANCGQLRSVVRNHTSAPRSSCTSLCLSTSGGALEKFRGDPTPKQLNGTPGKKRPAPSLRVRRDRSPQEQRSGTKPLEQSAQPQPTNETETGGVVNRFWCDASGGRMPRGVLLALPSPCRLSCPIPTSAVLHWVRRRRPLLNQEPQLLAPVEERGRVGHSTLPMPTQPGSRRGHSAVQRL
jgi:hypothetical protein